MSVGYKTRKERRAVQSRVRSWPQVLTELPRDQWPIRCQTMAHPPDRVFVSQTFIVQVYKDASHFRLSVSRSAVDEAGNYPDGITWDELQRIKLECGFGGCWAVECYPPENDVVNVANLRHLWLLSEQPAFGWTRRP